MSAIWIAGIVVAVIVLLVAFGWLRQIRGAKKFDDAWSNMSYEEKRRVQEQCYKAKIV